MISDNTVSVVVLIKASQLISDNTVSVVLIKASVVVYSRVES